MLTFFAERARNKKHQLDIHYLTATKDLEIPFEKSLHPKMQQDPRSYTPRCNLKDPHVIAERSEAW